MIERHAPAGPEDSEQMDFDFMRQENLHEGDVAFVQDTTGRMVEVKFAEDEEVPDAHADLGFNRRKKAKRVN